MGDVVALGQVDAEPAQQRQRRGVLDPLGDRPQMEVAGQCQDGVDDVAARGAVGQVADELDVQLEVVDGYLLEVGQRAVAGAEIIQGDLAAQRVKALGEGPGGI